MRKLITTIIGTIVLVMIYSKNIVYGASGNLELKLSYIDEDSMVRYDSFIGRNGECILYLPCGSGASGIIKSNLEIDYIEDATLLSKNEIKYNGGVHNFKVHDLNGNMYIIHVDESDISSCSIILNDISLDTIHDNGKNTRYFDNKVIIQDNGGKKSYKNVDIKGRGNFTWSLPKKSYQLSFEKEADILTMGNAKKWILLPNYTDNSLMRNMLAFDLAKMLQIRNAIDAKWIDLWINGEYLGNYIICEKIEIDNNRVDLKDDYGVLIELDNLYYQTEDIFKKTEIYENVFVLKDAVKKNNREEAIKKFMKQINEFESLLDQRTSWEIIASKIDVESFVKMYFLQELSEDSDGCRSSFFLYMDGEKDLIHLGPAWDYDIAFGNFSIEKRGGNPFIDYICKITNYMEVSSSIFEILMEYEEFQKMLNKFYYLYCKELLRKSFKLINNYYGQIEKSAFYNFEKWTTQGERAVFEGGHTNKNTYSEEVGYLCDWLSKRIQYLDFRYALRYIINSLFHMVAGYV